MAKSTTKRTATRTAAKPRAARAEKALVQPTAAEAKAAHEALSDEPAKKATKEQFDAADFRARRAITGF
jgi:hypothetical protein